MKSNLVPNFVHVHILNFKFMNSNNIINTLNIKDTVRVDLGKRENPSFLTLHFPPKKTKTKRKEVLKMNDPELKIKTVVFEIVVQWFPGNRRFYFVVKSTRDDKVADKNNKLNDEKRLT